MDCDSILTDSYPEEKQQRYLELIGHTDEYLYKQHNEWTHTLFHTVRQQGIEKEKWNCPSYGEVSINYVTSEYLQNTHKHHFIPTGTDCAICFEPMMHNKNAYITECGHHFHKSCITSLYNTSFLEKNFRCPLCRCHLKKCLWLETRYALEPWRLMNKKNVCGNVDFEFQKDLFCEDSLLCRGCHCRQGCFQIVGRNPHCEACQAWKRFTLEDLHHECSDNSNIHKTRGCCWSKMFMSIRNGVSFLMDFRHSLVTNN